MAAGIKTGGRKKGVPNKLNSMAKDNIAAVFIRLGGTAAMAEWAAKNRTEFYRLYSKLIPVALGGPDGKDIPVGVNVRFVGD